jgi:hypothetical protein
MKLIPPLLLSAALALSAAGSLRAEALGRLLFTPAERHQLDQGLAAPAEGAPQHLDGVLTRSDGHQTLFIDGKATSPLPAAQHRSPDRAGFHGDDGRRLKLPAGESLPPGP